MTMVPAHSPDPIAPVSVDDQRWRPVRAGLLNVWQYADEVLEFERGRLVLYGPNGSGKTMALELLLPHLLDAKGQPGRLSTSGADRGGLWERVSGYDEGEPRTGYLWIEFAREGGSTFTAGVRLRAKPSGGGDKHWFTTPRRIGIDFKLLDEHRRPLAVEQLADAVGPQGRIWGADTAGYRQAVRITLFPGWSDDRLDALIRTLLVVRKQSVTDGLSSARLSELLCEALPPLDDLELGRVADGFADLDRRRDHIEQLESDVAATRRLADANCTYARAVVAHVVGEVVAATTGLDNVTRDVRRLSNELEECTTCVSDLAAREESLDIEDQGLAGRVDGLKNSEAYKHGAALENLQQAVEGAKRRADEAERDAGAERDRARRRREGAMAAVTSRDLAVQQVRRARQELEAASASLGAGMLEEVADDALVGVTNVWIGGREQAIQDVRTQLHALDLAVERRKGASQHKTSCDAQLGHAEEGLHAAAQAADEARRLWQTSLASWRADARELGPFLVAMDDPTTASGLVAQAWNHAQEPLIDRRSQVQQRRSGLDAQLAELRSEREAWLAGKEPEPDIPAGRRDRTSLSGAPLWRIVQFRDQVQDTVRGNIESALADARLLDAWVAADGGVSIAEGESDLLLLEPPTTILPEEHDRTLASLLEPDPAADALSRDTVERLLLSFALVDRDAHATSVSEGGVLIGMDGSWRTLRLAGRAAPGPALYIGASSREATRRARISSLEEGIAERELEQQSIQTEHHSLEERLHRCEQEARAFPSTSKVQEADQAVDRDRVRVESARDMLVQANTRLLDANEGVKHHQRELHRVAGGHDLPTEGAKLDDVRARLVAIRNQVFAFQQGLQRSESTTRDAVRAEDAAEEAEAEANRRTETAYARRGEYEQAAGRFAAVEAAVGADFREVLDQIGKATSRRAAIQLEQRSVRAQRNEAGEKRGSIANELIQAEARRTEAESQRTRAGESFVALCRDGLVVDAEIESPPEIGLLISTTAILDAARRIRSAGVLPASPDDPDLIRMSNTVMARVGDASRQLAGRADLTFETTERGWSILRARREGIISPALALLDGLRHELDAARAELSQKQQELFEQILSGSVREHLKERLWAAQALVDRINALLGEVRTEAGGVKVSLKWEIDPDQSEAAELRQAKELLLHDSPVAQGRAELDAFLRGRIERVRAAEDDTGEWRDRLARMLDYRSWHRFRVLVHHNRFGEQPRALDSRKVSLSAGEKTIVMVLPLLAAVTAHYEPASGEPACISPRLLLMDELFPKLDFPNKRKLIGLLPTLDLDAVFTSDKDRCEYDTLDAIAIHVFQKLGDDKTATTRLVWNGVETRVSPAYCVEEPGEQQRSPTLVQVKG